MPSNGGGAALAVQEGSLRGCSPDGSVAYARLDGIHLLAPDGKSTRLLLRGAFAPFAAFGVSGRVLYVGRPKSRALAAIDTKTGNVLEDIEPEIDPADGIRSISIHPDGKRMR